MFVYQLVNAKKALDNVSHYQGLEFAYAVFKNKQLIDNKLMEVDFIKNVSPEVVEYENQRIKLCEDYSKKNDEGMPIIENDLYLIENQDEFKEKMKDLVEKYKPFVEERQKQIEIFNEKMNNQANIDWIKIKKDQIPLDIKTANELQEISFMID